VSAPPLTVIGAVLDGETVALRCVGGKIAALGPEVGPEPGDETIDAAGAPLVPPLVNAHTHAAMTLFRGHGGDRAERGQEGRCEDPYALHRFVSWRGSRPVF